MESKGTHSAGAPDFDFGNGGRYYFDTEPFGAMITEGVAKFRKNGLLDMTYGSGGIGYHETLFHFRTLSGVESMVAHDGDKVVLVGNGQVAYSSPWNGVLGGLDAAGGIDPGFNGGERAEIPPVDGMRIHITDSLPDGDGLLVYGVVGQTQGMTRYLLDGSMDTGFGDHGWWLYGATRFAQGMARQPDGKIVALGAVDSGGFLTTDFISRFLGS